MLDGAVQERTSDVVSFEDINTDITEKGSVQKSLFPNSQQTPGKTLLNSSTLDKNTKENKVHDIEDTPKMLVISWCFFTGNYFIV